jgi:soluble lytic murein transglycosylase-like protein
MIYTAVHPLVLQVSSTYGLQPDLLAAQIQVESSGDPFAFRYEKAYFEHYILNNAGAEGYAFGPLAACSYGLLQILLETALENGFDGRPEQLFDPKVGLSWGAKYLQRCLLLTNQDYPLALKRYNGSGTAAEQYAAKVLTVRDQQVNG